MPAVESIKRALSRKRQKEGPPQLKDMLSSGSTLLNLSATDNPNGCYVAGRYYLFVGDTQSGKTWLTIQALAEALRKSRFAKHRLIFDDAEGGALMDIRRYFGDKLAEALEAPAYDGDGHPQYSVSIEDFYFNLDDAFKQGQPFIYILDSTDVLTSEDEEKTFRKQKKAHRSGTKMPGSYGGGGKARKHSHLLRRTISRLRKTGSILIVINQTRDSFDAWVKEKTRSGGHALEFYATLEIWTSIKFRIKKEIRGKDRQLGIMARIRVKKNRVRGKDRVVFVPIYHSVGVDEVGSCIDYLIEEKHWAVRKSTIVASEFDFEGKREKLIRYIERNDLERDLRSIVHEVWQEIEAECTIKRKPRYE